MMRSMPLFLGLLTILAGCQPSSTSDSSGDAGSFGRFEGVVVASWDDNGRNMTLREPFAFIDSKNRTWLAPAGTVVDGASIPAAFWTFIGGPFEGKYRSASVVHDVGCVEMKETWEDVHWMFYEACRCAGVDDANAKMLYYAVYHFGPRWQPVTETVVEQLQTPDGQMVEQEVTVEHMVRMDPLPPTTTELQQVEAFVREENPAPQEIEQLNRDSLHRRPWRGRGGPRPSQTPDSNQPSGEATSPTAEAPAGQPQQPVQGFERPMGNGYQRYSGNRPSLPYTGNPQGRSTTGNGYNRSPAGYRGYSGHRHSSELPTMTPEEEQWAMGLVRQHIEQQSGEQRMANYVVERIRGGYRVHVKFLQADEAGQLVPIEGGGVTVRLSRQGAIMEMISGT